jgi:hypothetical protein
MPLPFDIGDPPEEPPNSCAYPERWRWHYVAYQQHVLGKYQRCACGDSWPCPVGRFAIRGLLDTCAADYVAMGVVAMTEARGGGWLRTVDTGTCKWCGKAIELRRVLGWVHIAEAFYVCRVEMPGLGRAEPTRR